MSAVNKQNSDYRALIVENDHHSNMMQKELAAAKKSSELKDKLVEKAEEEKRTF